MRTYARITSGTVAELLNTGQDVTHLFHPSLHWVDVTGKPVEVGWVTTVTGFAAPTPPTASGPAPVTLAQFQAQLAELSARVAKLTPKT
jgi:hypothetical protein